MYIKTHADGKITFILVYVDDLLIVGHKAKEHLQHISKRFKITIQESPSDFLGVEISRNRPRKQIKLHLKSYIDKTLEKFNMQNCKPATTPMAVGANLSIANSPADEAEIAEMKKVPYRTAVGSRPSAQTFHLM